MKTHLLFAVTVAVLLAGAASQLCPSQTLSAGIISDSLVFASGSNTPLQSGVNVKCFNYTFQASFTSAYQIAIATTGFEVSLTSDLAYYVRANPSPSNLNSISFQVRTPWRLGQWSKLTISFMAENRNDLELGSRMIDSAFVGGCGPRSQQLSINFDRPVSLTPTLVTRAFVNGISSNSNSGSPFELRLSITTPTSQSAVITLTINGGSNIDAFYISYLVYDPKVFGIQAVDGLFERSAVYNSISQQLSTSRNGYTYQLYGLSSFEFPSNQPPTFSAKVDNNTVLTITGLKNTQSFFAISYFLVQGSCSQCPSFPYLNGVNCVQNCPFGYPQNGICSNTPICGPFSAWNGSTCNCVTNYYNISGSCQQCPPGGNYNGYQCIQCPPNAVWNQTANQCNCSMGFFNNSGVCQQCPPGTQWNGYICAQAAGGCPPGSRWNGQSCIPFGNPNCGPNSYYNVSVNQCICNQGFYNISGNCQQCPPGTQWNGRNCAPFGNPNPNPSGPGINCPVGANCVLICSNYPNAVYNAASNQCVCTNNTYFINNVCQACPYGWVYNGYTCVQQQAPQPCPPNSYPNGNGCLCESGYIQTPNGCVPNGIPGPLPPAPSPCPDGMYFNQRNKACVLCQPGCKSCSSATNCRICNAGFSLQNRKCSEICGDGIRFTVSCDDGNNVDGDGCSNDCRIEQGWSCFGGSPTTSDSCTMDRPSGIMIYPMGQTHLNGKVISNVRVSWLPTELSQTGCTDCLDIRMISGSNIPRITSEYIRGTSFSFSIVFDFTREPINDFKFQVRINPSKSPYFPGMDISYAPTVSVNPSVLALDDNAGALDLGVVSAVALAQNNTIRTINTGSAPPADTAPTDAPATLSDTPTDTAATDTTGGDVGAIP